MPVIYDIDTKTDRMAATARRIDGGRLILGTAGMTLILARFELPTPCGEAVEGELRIAGDFLKASALADGDIATAAFVDAAGRVRIAGLTVGGKKSAANIRLDNLRVARDQRIELEEIVLRHA